MIFEVDNVWKLISWMYTLGIIYYDGGIPMIWYWYWRSSKMVGCSRSRLNPRSSWFCHKYLNSNFDSESMEGIQVSHEHGLHLSAYNYCAGTYCILMKILNSYWTWSTVQSFRINLTDTDKSYQNMFLSLFSQSVARRFIARKKYERDYERHVSARKIQAWIQCSFIKAGYVLLISWRKIQSVVWMWFVKMYYIDYISARKKQTCFRRWTIKSLYCEFVSARLIEVAGKCTFSNFSQNLQLEK